MLLIVAGAGATSPHGRAVIAAVYDYADAFIAENPKLGIVLFLFLAAVSAAFAFFSSAILIPVAIHVWGDRTTFALLWMGWFLGGMACYAMGRFLGRNVVEWVVPAERVARYEGAARREASFGHALAFQLAVPSEIPGYILGLLRYPFRRFIGVLAIAEIPFAGGAVYLGSTFVRGEMGTLLLIGAAAVALSATGVWLFERRTRHAWST